MYDSELSDWTAAKMGPRRDLLGELRSAILAEGLHFGLSSHRAEHDWFFEGGRHSRSDVNDPAYAAFYGPAQDRLPPRSAKSTWETTSPMSVRRGWTTGWRVRRRWSLNINQSCTSTGIGQPSYRSVLPKFLAYYYNRGGVGLLITWILQWRWGRAPRTSKEDS